jgi:hypothetical protein
MRACPNSRGQTRPPTNTLFCSQGQQLRRAKKAFEPIVIDVNIEAVADQARGIPGSTTRGTMTLKIHS